MNKFRQKSFWHDHANMWTYQNLCVALARHIDDVSLDAFY